MSADIALRRTRIKICGITRERDLELAVELGADAIGLVFYPESPRAVTPQRAAELLRRLPPFVSAVGLFVNADDAMLAATCATVWLALLQFHGDEPPARCEQVAARFSTPFIRAARVHSGLDLLEFAQANSQAAGLLLDTHVSGYGGSGRTFDWSLIPQNWVDGQGPTLVLSGGLTPDNVFEAIRRVRPWAVDVSSGVEAGKGIKDAGRLRAFMQAVRDADASRQAAM